MSTFKFFISTCLLSGLALVSVMVVGLIFVVSIEKESPFLLILIPLAVGFFACIFRWMIRNLPLS